jgi:hypothetical protein
VTGETKQSEEQSDATPHPPASALLQSAREAAERLGESFQKELDEVIGPVVERIRTETATGGQEVRDLPQTLLRSDTRAQEIWTKARDKAAEKNGPGHGAERAGYDALKRQYEKKGHRWVKKSKESKDSG